MEYLLQKQTLWRETKIFDCTKEQDKTYVWRDQEVLRVVHKSGILDIREKDVTITEVIILVETKSWQVDKVVPNYLLTSG